jgi:hypothetical protein
MAGDAPQPERSHPLPDQVRLPYSKLKPGRRHSEPTNQRAFQTTLKSLQAIQKERKAAELTDAGSKRTSSPLGQQTDARSKTQRTKEFVSQPTETEPDDIPIGPPEGYFDGHALQAIYYAEMNALEEQERNQANERYLEKLRSELITPAQ